jgi:hypothetical protein
LARLLKEDEIKKDAAKPPEKDGNALASTAF